MFCRCIIRFKNLTIKRWLLTQSYQCTTLWNERLKNIDCKFSANELNIKLQASLNNDIPISALDFDILMNKINEVDVTNLNYVDTLIKIFRKTQESTKVYESSSHAVIKNLIDMDNPYHAFDLLKDRQNTGIFLDEVSTNLLINKFVADNNWDKAFLTSAEWLLQENFQSSKLCMSMSVLSALHYWADKSWQYKPPVVDVSKLPEEYVPVNYLKPNSFDDHFDLTKDEYRRRLLGKCLGMAVDHLDLGTDSEVIYLEMNLKLLGLALHERLDALIDHLKQWVQLDGVKLNDALIAQVQELIETSDKTNHENPVFHSTYSEAEVSEFMLKYQDLINQFRAKESVDNGDFVELATKFFSEKATEQSEQESDLVRQKYEQFNNNRVTMFDKTKQKLLNQSILDQSKTKLLDLMEEEERIKYFEMLPEIMYKAWLAKRTKREAKFSLELDEQENLDNIKKKEKQRFIVQHVQ